MFWNNPGGQGPDDRDLYLTQADLSGPGCLQNLLMVLMVPAITVEVFLRYRMGPYYILIGTAWAVFFLAFFAVTTRLQDQSILFFGVLFLAVAVQHFVSHAFTREQIQSFSSGMPHWLWGRFVGRNLWAQFLVMIFAEPVIVGGVAQLLIMNEAKVTGSWLATACFGLLAKNLLLVLSLALRRQHAVDGRLTAEAMRRLNSPTHRAAGQKRQPQVVRQAAPQAPPP